MHNTAHAREITDELERISDCDDTRRVSPFPCYLVWPQRDGPSFILLETSTADTLRRECSDCMNRSVYRICTLPEQEHCVDLALTGQIGSIMKRRRLSGQRSLLRLSRTHEMDTESDKARLWPPVFFFYLGAAWLNEGRGPGGRPSVSRTNNCENHARKMRTFFTRRLEPKTRSSYHIKWSNAK